MQPRDILRKIVVHIDDGNQDEQGFTARSVKSQLKQWMPYMPAVVVDKMAAQKQVTNLSKRAGLK